MIWSMQIDQRLRRGSWNYLIKPLVPNETTSKAMKDARAGKVKKVADLEALFADLTADT